MADEKISELEDIAKKVSKMKCRKKKRIKKRAPVNHGTISSSLIYI